MTRSTTCIPCVPLRRLHDKSEQKNKKKKNGQAQSIRVKATKSMHSCALAIGHWQPQHQSHRECFPFVSSLFFVPAILPVIWAAHEATRQWIKNHHCGCTEWKRKKKKRKTENENNKKGQERSRWNNKMKLTTTRKHDDKSNPTKLFMFYNK